MVNLRVLLVTWKLFQRKPPPQKANKSKKNLVCYYQSKSTNSEKLQILVIHFETTI